MLGADLPGIRTFAVSLAGRFILLPGVAMTSVIVLLLGGPLNFMPLSFRCLIVLSETGAADPAESADADDK